jgi:hypothetical protein
LKLSGDRGFPFLDTEHFGQVQTFIDLDQHV